MEKAEGEAYFDNGQTEGEENDVLLKICFNNHDTPLTRVLISY